MALGSDPAKIAGAREQKGLVLRERAPGTLQEGVELPGSGRYELRLNTAYADKPFEPEQLVEAVRRLMQTA